MEGSIFGVDDEMKFHAQHDVLQSPTKIWTRKIRELCCCNWLVVYDEKAAGECGQVNHRRSERTL